MKYEFRDVKCPWCEHVFMWNKSHGEWLVFHLYRLKESGKYVPKAKCPKCGMEMLVLEHVLEGIYPNDDRVEPGGLRD